MNEILSPCKMVSVELPEGLIKRIEEIVTDGFGGYDDFDQFVRITLAARVTEYENHRALVLNR